MKKGRVLSGMRPTSKLHLGNLLGALNNWRRLQEDYECFYMIADLHALTTDYADTSQIKANIQDMAIDLLSAGIDPERSTVFVQSQVPQHAQLHLLFSMFIPIPWLERNPTYKEQLHALKGKDLSTYGFLGYPVLQAADILIYKATVVPVGEDQLPHLELAREIARRFNHLYGKVFPIPEPKLTEVPKLPGTDGRKMSKSYNNCIYLSDSQAEIVKKVNSMITDPDRIRVNDPGHPKVCTAYQLHKVYSPEALHTIETKCRKGQIGCTSCKEKLANSLIKALTTFQEKRQRWAADSKRVAQVLEDGAQRADQIAHATLNEVKEAMGI
jgi:tryptophanyl-tRNA synthetase